MYINKCTKCGAEFETKNPKRVICPNCLYPDKKAILKSDSQENDSETNVEEKPIPRASYSSQSPAGEERRPFRSEDSRRFDNDRPRPSYNRPQQYGDRPQGNYNRDDRPYNPNYNRNDRPYNPNYNRGDRPQGNYNRDDRPHNANYQRVDRPHNTGDRPFNPNYNRGDRPQGNYGDRPRPSFDNRPPQRPGFNRNARPQRPKQLLVSREQIAQIEILYKKTLPLPNPDIHEVIGGAIDLEPRKVFFGINLVRQKLMLPKLAFPKRKLAVSADQLFAIKSLYEPLLPLPPIGCHKILAAQLKMDEWRVHVGIGLVRKQMGLDRWNPDRPDAPAEFKK